MEITWSGLEPADLDRVRTTGTDHGGNPVTAFTDDEGGWPLRCCLRLSAVGERLAIVSFSPFPWSSPYRETGPVVVHAEACDGPDGRFPSALADADRVVRAFGTWGGRDRTQVYDLNRLVPAGTGLQAYVEHVLADDRVEFVHVHSATAQCFTFAASRAG